MCEVSFFFSCFVYYSDIPSTAVSVVYKTRSLACVMIDVEHKKTEFDHAYFGSIGLESCFGALRSLVDTETAIKALNQLKNRFGIVSETIEEGNKANITFFNPDEIWKFSEADITSTSKNSAFLNQKLKGKAYGIFANNKLVLNN
mgnify:CR=1 FL=1